MSGRHARRATPREAAASGRRTARTAALLGVLLLCAVAAGLVWTRGEPSVAPPTAPAPAATRVAAARVVPAPGHPPARVPETAPAAPEPAAPAPALPPAARSGDLPLLADEKLIAHWERELERQKQADARFERGLEESQVRARDVDARVKDAFSRVDFAPELADGGMLRGLRIRSVEGGTAFAQAGFLPGDLLVRIDGQALSDPADLPRIFAGAPPELSLCALRDGRELCRDLVLR